MLGQLFLRKGVGVLQSRSRSWAWLLLLWLAWLAGAAAADPPRLREQPSARAIGSAQPTATIHWRQLPLRDSVRRLEEVFGARVFVDRRVDPSQRVSLDIEASRAGEVLSPLAARRGLGVGRLEGLLYLGPRQAAEQLRPLADRRAEDVERLPAPQRATLQRRRPARWPRLTEPRELVVKLVEQRGWRVEHAQRIPHDLWPAGDLPELTLAEQLSVLLLGFDLTFAVRARERTVEIVPWEAAVMEELAAGAKPQAAGERRAGRTPVTRNAPQARQVYTLRVSEQPVRAVLQEFSRRLNWQIEVDEASIRAAKRSVEKRVSFAVENVAQDELLDALLRPAGLGFVREGERIKIVPRDDAH